MKLSLVRFLQNSRMQIACENGFGVHHHHGKKPKSESCRRKHSKEALFSLPRLSIKASLAVLKAHCPAQQRGLLLETHIGSTA
jgi:hypothetical protein